MLKIGEFARVAHDSIATLRHYEKVDLLKPAVLDPDTSGQPAIQLTKPEERLLTLPNGADVLVCVAGSVCPSTQKGLDSDSSR